MVKADIKFLQPGDFFARRADTGLANLVKGEN